MTEEDRLARGLEIREKVHGDAIPPLTGEMGTYTQLSVRNIYNDVWGRDVMSVRDRRLMVMGALAAMTLMNPLEIHLRSALTLGELTWEEIDEFAIAVSPYIGAPRTTYVLQLIGKLKSEASKK